MYRLLFIALTIVLTPELRGQSGDGESSGRLDQIEAQRIAKSGDLRIEQPTATERTFTRISHLIRHMPVSFQVGGLGPGAGPAIGSVLQSMSHGDRVLARLWGTGSIHGFYSAGTGVELRNISKHALGFALEASHADAPQLEYYGPGPNSSIHNRTNFRREDTLFDFRVGLRAQRHLALACRLGELLQNVGPGTNRSLASTESVFGSAEAPGINVQSNFLIGGCSAQVDLRDLPEDPHKGTYAEATYDRYYAGSHDPFSFHLFSAVGEQYVPFFNRKRVIAIRAKTELSFHSGDQAVPFYLQPTLGSDTDLRGFRRYRFYDENSIALNGEYRWEINTGFDMALFVDGGKVFHRPGQISLSRLESSAGFGLRFKNRTSVVARLDTGFSREGFQVWLKFGKLFGCSF
ncbi:MAG TPA: BamA/TamA family outer membrane protein [Terriglobia bacterium]|nr:BamA/TamA family outer membrane protein [Terriglobia bacterium]